MKIPLFLVDAFAERPFTGNPAAVCLLEEKLDEAKMQAIAAEMNLSETAFLQPLERKSLKQSSLFSLRWFTPKVEVPLCGHATLATGKVLFFEIGNENDSLAFETMSGTLIAARESDRIVLNFPSDDPVPMDQPVEIIKALGIDRFLSVGYSNTTNMILIHLQEEESVKKLRPDFERMRNARTREKIIGVIATASGDPPYDFVSRFFAPWVGINEDPVTGSAHTVLARYWSKVTGKKEMTAYQASPRGGTLKVRLSKNDRVDLIGNAIIMLKGNLIL